MSINIQTIEKSLDNLLKDIHNLKKELTYYKTQYYSTKKENEELQKQILELNDKKTHVINKSSRQYITGIVVNKKVQVNVNYRKKIRQEIYYIKKFGLNSHLKKCNINIEPSKYLNILYGKILYILQVNDEDKAQNTNQHDDGSEDFHDASIEKLR